MWDILLNGVMPHRTGSRPHRQLIFEKGGGDGKSLDVAQLFFETRQINGNLELQAQEKFDEIVKIVKSNPSMSLIELIEQSFGPQKHSHVFGYGGGVKRKDFSDSRDIYIKELEVKIREKDEENHKLRSRFDTIESRLGRIEDTQPNLDTPQPSNMDTNLEQVNMSKREERRRLRGLAFGFALLVCCSFALQD